jgi:flagellar protein FlbD
VIHLTRLNSQAFAINSDLIKFIENAPDTVLTLTNGEKIIVRESTEQVVERIIAFRRAVIAGLLSIADDPNLPAAAMARREVNSHTDPPRKGLHHG